MPVNFTEIVADEEVDSAALNLRLSDLDEAIEAIKDGDATQTTPTISSFINAEHDHEDAAGGGQLGLAALDVSGADDGDVLQVSGGAVVAAPIGQIPTGAVMPYAGATAPPGYLLCDGQAVNRTTYAVLFAVIGETYGNGNGTTTFNVPDLRGLVPAGLDNMGGSSANRITDANADVLGGEVGAEDHVLTIDELAVHNHNGAGTFYRTQGNDLASIGSGSSASVVAPTVNNGSGDPHNNLQPTLFLNYIIKT